MMKTYIINITIGFFTLFSLPAIAQKGPDILDKAAKAYESANGISATFALHVRNEAQHLAESFEGKIQMRGDKFTFATPDMRVWYDGQTQWSYLERNQEVNVTQPTGDELQYTNPAVLLHSYRKGYNAKYIGESTAASGKSAFDVELTPKKRGDITRITLQIEKNSSFPTRIEIEDKNTTRTRIQIDRFTTGLNQPDSFFVFNEKEYPDAYVNDLR